MTSNDLSRSAETAEAVSPTNLHSRTTSSPTRTRSTAGLDHRLLTFVLLLSTLAAGIAYSVHHDTYLDTSDPLIAHLPHPSHNDSYFARKSNVLNQLFVKKAWGWTSLAFFLIYGTSSAHRRSLARIGTWFATTSLWGLFTLWFFGPSLFERLLHYSGGECVVAVPPTLRNEAPHLLHIPVEYCHTKSTVGIDTHPALFTSMLMPPPETWRGRPRLYRGHDVSGHIFLLTLCIFFLADQIALSLKPRPAVISRIHATALNAALALLGIWWWMTLMTAVYFHTPMEKITGFVMGTITFAITQIVAPSRSSARVGVLIPEDKLRVDGMHLD